jgi:hypothetical protein
MLMMGVHQTSSLSQEKYEEVVRRLTGKQRADSPADFPFEGLLVHMAGQSESGFWIVDIWESEEAVRRFGEIIGPIAPRSRD